jgi:hypothetical protein
MTEYIVHIYREMRLTYTGIEADTPEAAAVITRGKPTDDADNVEDCDGENLAALVDVAGDKDYSQSRFIDFEGEKQRKAASKLLEAVRMAENYLADDLDQDDETEMRIFKAICNARAEATAASIPLEPVVPKLLVAIEGIIVYAENEAHSLENLKDSPEAEVEAEKAWKAVEAARNAIAGAKNACPSPPTAAAGLSVQGTDPAGETTARFDIEHNPEENPDRAYVLVDGIYDVAIIRTGEGIVINVYPKDWIDPIDTLTIWDEQVAATHEDGE